jgi:methionyl aminopeptidase
VQKHAESHGYGVIRSYTGHGIGKEMHEDPSVPNFGRLGTGMRLRAGTVLCIEPMIAMGSWKVKILGDDWTAVTVDGKLAAHYENTVVVREDGVEILTL